MGAKLQPIKKNVKKDELQIYATGQVIWKKVVDFTKMKPGGVNIDELLSKF